MVSIKKTLEKAIFRSENADLADEDFLGSCCFHLNFLLTKAVFFQ
jgi:hypothetical protein